MKEKTVKDHQGKKHPADTARQGGAAYAPHNESAEELAEGVGDARASPRPHRLSPRSTAALVAHKRA